MMEKLEARGQRLAAEKQAEAIARVAERAGETLTGIASTAQADGVELTGRGLERRPGEFWAATPAELETVVRALAGDETRAAAPDAAAIAALKEKFPDG